jgi:hypothetical protein
MVNATGFGVQRSGLNRPLLGVPSLPPKAFGFRHLVLNGLYLHQGRLYHTPSSESEFCLFHVSTEDDGKGTRAVYPLGMTTSPYCIFSHPLISLGGHNYYWRDMEKFVRRMEWVGSLMKESSLKECGWEDRYRTRVAKREWGWNKATRTMDAHAAREN